MSSTTTPEQFQYACDLMNRNNERTDAAQMKCKVGKPCNGRCIPQNHQCQPDGTGRRSLPGGEEHETYHHARGYQQELTPKGRQAMSDLKKKGRKELVQSVAGLAGIGAALGGLSLANAAAKKKAKQNQAAADKKAADEEYFRKVQEDDKEWEEARRKRMSKKQAKQSQPAESPFTDKNAQEMNEALEKTKEGARRKKHGAKT